jgi:hypothetical protein
MRHSLTVDVDDDNDDEETAQSLVQICGIPKRNSRLVHQEKRRINKTVILLVQNGEIIDTTLK